jgi:hypothetical protein
MAGLLTYPDFIAPSQSMRDQWQVAKNLLLNDDFIAIERDLQQRVLLRNHTSFPFDAPSHLRFGRQSNHFDCKGTHCYYSTQKNTGQSAIFTSTTPRIHR